MSFNAIRVGKCYFLSNRGERFEFEVISRIEDQDYQLKDLNTLENYRLSDLVGYGYGPDYDLDELPKDEKRLKQRNWRG
jgi:hypothetical protein